MRLVHCPKLHLAADGLFAWTRSLDWQDGAASLAHLQAEVDVCNETGEPRVAEVEVWLTPEAGGEAVARCAQVLQVNPGETAVAHLRFVLEKPALWQAGSPNLYRLHARVTEQGVFTTHLCPAEAPMTDEDSVLFGVRTVQVDPVHGLRINGRTTKLKGGCLHHDNGVAGAVSLYDLEVRKLQALQAIGFNAVRTAHNPPSAAFIEACDRLGLYVLDEAFDAWGMGKQPGDYNQFFDTDWQRDLAAFVRRDRAHPSVILWSTGNEIVERGGLGGGYPLAARLAEAVHALDPSRPVTNAICSYWNGTDDAAAREMAIKILSAGQGTLQNAQGDGKGDTGWERRSAPFGPAPDCRGRLTRRRPQRGLRVGGGRRCGRPRGAKRRPCADRRAVRSGHTGRFWFRQPHHHRQLRGGPLPGLPRPRAGCGARRVRDRQRDPDRDRRGPAHRQLDTGRSPRGRRGLTAVPHEPHQAARLTPHGLPLNVQMLPAVQHDTAKVESPAQSRRPMLRSCFSLRCDGL